MEPDKDRRLAHIAEAHHGCFNFEHLDLLVFSEHEREHRLRSGRWVELHDRAYRLAGTPSTWRGELLAACWAGGTRAAASHRAAAALHDLPGRDVRLIEITCPRWRRTRTPGLVVHESRALPDRDLTVVDAIPVTTVERTIFDLCAVRGRLTVDMAIDSALRRELTTFDRLAAASRRLGRRGLKGTVVLRSLLSARDPQHALTESEQERLLLEVLRRHGFADPVPQFVIRDERGTFVARVDFAYPELRIAIEYDSYEWHVGHQQHVRDNRRRNALWGAGFVPIVATAEDVRYGQGHVFASALRQAITRAQARAA